jgi:hypothetical protein
MRCRRGDSDSVWRRLPNGTDPALKLASLQFVEWQRQQEVDASSQRHESVIKGTPLGLKGSRGTGGVFHPPVRENGLAGEKGARLLGPVAHGDHDVPRLAFEAVHPTRGMPSPRDVMAFQRLDRQRMDRRRWVGPSALSAESPGLRAVQICRGHLAPGRVPCAQKQHAKCPRAGVQRFGGHARVQFGGSRIRPHQGPRR